MKNMVLVRDQRSKGGITQNNQKFQSMICHRLLYLYKYFLHRFSRNIFGDLKIHSRAYNYKN